MKDVGYLTTHQAAEYLGYVKPDGTVRVSAFYVFIHRHKVKRYKLGRCLRFRRVDLDRAVQPVSVVSDLVSGTHHLKAVS